MESFENMLDNVYSNMVQYNESLNITLQEPEIIKSGHNYIWKNVKEYLKITKRPPNHFLSFLTSETTSKVNWITESKSDGIIFNQKKITSVILINLMKKYLKEAVICKSCKSMNTYIEKDKNVRKYNFVCLNCNNEYCL